MSNRYIEYFRDNPKGYWFKRRLYGWGWVPARWQGWAVIAVYAAVLLWTGISMSKIAEPSDSQLAGFFLKIGITTAILFAICWKKGETPRWQWGLPDPVVKDHRVE